MARVGAAAHARGVQPEREMPPLTRSRALHDRARHLIPGAHHLSGRPLIDVERSPQYFDRARGCRITDIDGNEYIDYLLAYGAVLLGYAHEEVDAAAVARLRQGSLVSLNHPLHVEFIETLIARVPGMEQGVFVKTGSDATTAALRIARRATGRRFVARCGYHGWHDWCLPLDPAVPKALDQQVFEFSARDPLTLQAIVRDHPRELAAVIIAPEMVHPPDPETFHAIVAIARAAGAVVIFDEVKTGIRTRPGTIQQLVGVRPDLTTLSKALGNGWPVAVVLGRRSVMEHAAGLHLSATYHGDTAPMAAALATLAIVDRDHVTDHVWTQGERLMAGLTETAARHDVSVTVYGEPTPAMPFMTFTHPDATINARVRDTFYAAMLARGILLHPRHLWFISAAHGPAEIDRTIEAADEAFALASLELE